MTDTALAALADFEAGPVDRLMLALYAGASGDHTMIHLDSDIARGVGLPDAIGHGMLTMAIVGRALAHWFGLRHTQELAVRFQAPVIVGDRLRCSAEVVSSRREGEAIVHELSIVVTTDGRKVMSGTARVISQDTMS